MKPFDHRKITPSIYTIQALPLSNYVFDVLKLKSSRQSSFIQEIRLNDKIENHAYTSPEFLCEVASSSLFPNISSHEVDKIVNSDAFNVKVWIKPIKKTQNKKSTPFLLSTSSFQEHEIRIEEYIGLPRSWCEKEKIFKYDNTVVSVDPVEIYYWRTHEETLKNTMRESRSKTERTTEYILRILREMSNDS